MRRSTINTVITALLLAVSASAGVAQQTGYARARAALSGEAGVQFEHTIRTARAQGLPTESLVAKALEGIAKGVAPDRIAFAVQQHAGELGRAQALLRIDAHNPASGEVEAVADALRRGVPADAVRKLRGDARPNESIALSVHALADLLQRGVPVAIAVDVIGAWRGRGADPARLAEIPAAVERLVRQGVLPAQAGVDVAAGVREGKGLGTLGTGAKGKKP